MVSRFFSIGAVILCLVSCSWFDFSRSKVTVDEVQKPVVSLFDGGGLDEWVAMGDRAGWTVVNGAIHTEGGKGGGWLRSQKEYTDFALNLEYKISAGGNGGIFVRCAEQGNPGETGYLCPISCEQPPRDDLHCTGSLSGYASANPRPEEIPDVWRRCEILCKGKRIMFFIDGRKTVDVVQDDVEAIRNKPLQGYIGLQDSRAGEGSSIEYRNIQVRELN